MASEPDPEPSTLKERVQAAARERRNLRTAEIGRSSPRCPQSTEFVIVVREHGLREDVCGIHTGGMEARHALHRTWDASRFSASPHIPAHVRMSSFVDYPTALAAHADYATSNSPRAAVLPRPPRVFHHPLLRDL